MGRGSLFCKGQWVSLSPPIPFGRCQEGGKFFSLRLPLLLSRLFNELGGGEGGEGKEASAGIKSFSPAPPHQAPYPEYLKRNGS